MIMHSLNPEDCFFGCPTLIDCWKVCNRVGFDGTWIFRVKVARAKIPTTFKNGTCMNLYTLVGVSFRKGAKNTEYAVENYEEGFASCRHLAEYYGIKMPEIIETSTKNIALNKMKKILNNYKEDVI